jgi:DNA-binding transcriptional MerR regulator
MSQVSCELPQKLFYRIQEVSRITGIKPYVLRYWETEFPLLKPEKGPNDQRRYRAGDIDFVRRIKNLLYEQKFTIAGARRQIEAEEEEARSVACRRGRSAKQAEAPPKPNVERFAQRLRHVRQELIDLQAFLAG